MSRMEHTTITKCASQLVSAFVSDGKAMFLFCQKFSHNDLYERLVEMKTPADKAAMFVNEIVERVKLQPSNYFNLVNLLRQYKKYSDVVNIMDAEYFGIRKWPASHEAMQIDVLHKELSGIKDKWRSIGKGLNIPGEHLDMFMGVTDPLLEVIVHWLMRGDKEPPSWDLIVLLLQSQSVNEAKLADRISRLYCGRKEKMTVKGRQAPSDITSGLVRVPIESKHQSFDSSLKIKFSTTELRNKTLKIKKSFTSFLFELQQHILVLQKEGALDISVIKSHILMYDKKLIIPMSQCKSVHDLFETLSLPEHSSFLNYDLIKILAEYGSEKIKRKFMDYKRHLQKFFEHRMIIQSSGEIVVVIDNSITCEISDYHQLQNQIRLILGHRDMKLIFWEDIAKSDVHSMSTRSQDYSLEKTYSFTSHQESAVINMQMDSTSASVLSFTQQNFVEKDIISITRADSSSEQNLSEKLDSTQDFSLNDNITIEFLLVMVDGAKQLPSSNDQQHTKASEGDLPGIVALIEKGYNPTDKDKHSNTALHYAALNGHLNLVKYFIDELGFDPTISGYKHNSVLHYAVLGGHLSVVQYLLHEKKVDALCHADLKTTPLHYACFFGYSDIMLELIQTLPIDQDYNIQSANGLTPLQLAAGGGWLSVVKYLVSRMKCDQSCKSSNGTLPVYIAAMHGQLEIVQFLTSDCSPMIADGNGNTILHFATARGHLQIIQYFIDDRKFSPSIKNYKGLSPLHIAVEIGCLPIVKYLTSIQDYRSYSNSFDDNSYTLMHLAARHGHLSIIKHLVLSIKVNPMCKNKNGISPLHVAASYNHLNVTEFFLSLPDSTVYATDCNGRTPLHAAAVAGNLDIVKYYIEQKGCNPAVVDNIEMTPLSYAAARGHLSVVKYLTLDQNCDPFFNNKEGGNTFHVAADNGHVKVVQFLFSVATFTLEMITHALCLAAKNGHVSVVKFLVLDKKCDPFDVDEQSKLAFFHLAAIYRQIEIIKLCISELNCLFRILTNATIAIYFILQHLEDH